MDNNIKAVVDDRVATAIGDPVIVCGNSDYTITFTFDDEWECFEVKTALFKWLTAEGVRKHEQPFTGDTVAVPVLNDTREVEVGVYAGDLTTTTGAPIRCLPSIRCGTGEKVELDPDKYDALMQLIEKNLRGFTAEQAADLEANTQARHEHANAEVLAGFGVIVRDDGTQRLGWDIFPLPLLTDIPTKTSQLVNDSEFITLDDLPEDDGGGKERPTATYEYEVTNDGASYSVGSVCFISSYSIPEDMPDGAEIKNIEFKNSNGDYVSIRNLISEDFIPYVPLFDKVHLDPSGSYCFGEIAFIDNTPNWVATAISIYSSLDARITYYTD